MGMEVEAGAALPALPLLAADEENALELDEGEEVLQDTRAHKVERAADEEHPPVPREWGGVDVGDEGRAHAPEADDQLEVG